MKKNRLPKVSKNQLIFLCCTTLVILFGLLFLTRKSVFKVATQNTVPTKTTTKVRVLTAENDMRYMSTSKYPPLFSVIIPKGARYYQNGEPLFIEGTNGLAITICSTCQLFIENCGGLSDGNTQEGGCAVKQISLGNKTNIGMHYQQKNLRKILGYFDNYKNSDGENISIKVTTPDFRSLTKNDKSFLHSIVSSLQ